MAAEFLPPIERGDIDRLLARDQPPEVIGIVDGKFLQTLSISPKEVLRAVDRGVRVFGSSSMGALRAVECEQWGMTGIGRIFDEYRSGRNVAEDEVALVFDERTGTALSEPMINLRFAIADAVAGDEIDAETGDVFLAEAKAPYFPHRTSRNVLRLIEDRVPPAEHAVLVAFFAHGAPDAKREDALELLGRIRDHLDDHPTRPIGPQPMVGRRGSH